MEIKLNSKYLDTFSGNDVLNKFGDWTNNIEHLNKQFINAKPFEHVIIPNFLSDEYAEEIHKQIPTDYKNWHTYMNPIEVKYAYDNINSLNKPLKDLFYLLSTDEMVKVISEMSGIKGLQHDEYLNGAGLHAHPRNGRLNMHLDYEKHPVTGK